jgi:cytochrome P450
MKPSGPTMLETYARLGVSSIRNLHEFLTQIDRRYGHVARFRLLTGAFYLVSAPDAIEEVLVTKQHEFSKMRWAVKMRLLLGDGLLTSEEPKHRQMRRIVQPAFHRKRIEGYALEIRDLAERFAAEIPAGTFDMHAAMTELTLRIASKTLFGADTDGQAAHVSQSLHALMEMFPKVLAPLGELRLLVPSRFTRRYHHLRKELDTVVLRLIAERRAEGIDRGDALSMLLASRDAETGAGLDDAQVRDEAMTLFTAGHETTANALTWTWYLLSQHPVVAERFFGEVRGINADPARLDAFEAFPYAMAVIRESMRLYPPAWIIGRQALRDVTIAGFDVKKGATVLMSPLVVQRLADYYDRPESFAPERWLANRELPPFAYFPFGGGARRCIGEQFAWIEMLIVLVTLGRLYRFERVGYKPIEPQAIITLRPSEPVLMRRENSRVTKTTPENVLN